MKRLLSVSSSLLIATLFLFGHAAQAADPTNGEILFNKKCNACHMMGRPLVGPNLEGVSSRWTDKELLHTWIKNPSKAKALGDPYITQLLAEWESRGGLMNPQTVTDAEIDDILAYIDAWKAPEPVVSETASANTEGESGATSDKNIIILGLVLVVLLIVLGLLIAIKRRVSTILKEQANAPTESPKGPFQVLIAEIKDFIFVQMNPTILVLTVGGILTLPVLFAMYSSGQDLGLQQGYAPDQPIKFSHKLHAGQYGIDCQYCHTGVEKSKNANIPSVNICMNCHNVVQSGPKYGKDEIAKIYAAIGYDVNTASYTGETKPIEWVRIHNLPDHAYFNHKQHVVAGNLDCETCHGNVREMEVVQQVSLLEMGWCINCHRETEVVIDNNYYQEHFHQVFEDDYAAYLKKNPKKGDEEGSGESDKDGLGDFVKNHKKYTVGDLGGLECQKCHY